MGVASHLGIKLTEYDSRIRTFIPHYEEMLDVAARAVPRTARTIVDLGVGTGALSARCLKAAPKATVVGIDVDPEILAMARRRLGDRGSFMSGSFLRAALPRCDAAVASFALHHVRTRAAKGALYRRVHSALRPGGALVIVDCAPGSHGRIRAAQFEAWQLHLRDAYNPAEARAILRAWAREDVYLPLEVELSLLNKARFRVELLWRRGAFAVLRAAR